MVIYRSLDAIDSLERSVLTIGSFDGLHRGHQEIIKRVVITARATNTKSVVITFEPHPKQILMNHSPERFQTLLDVNKKINLLQELDVDIVLIIPFDLDFSRMSSVDFIEKVVVRNFHPRTIIVGYDHHFGHNRRGDSEFLRSKADRGDYFVEVVDRVKDQEEVISSSRIRTLIRDGNVRRASFELGWVFGFEARIVQGIGRGRSLEFPTANFVPTSPSQLLPKNGVYFARGIIDSESIYGMCNLGYRPTFGEKDFVMEIHFFRQLGKNLCGETIEVQFLERIRDEKRFDSPEKLKEQLKKDRQYCLSRLNIYVEEEACR